MTLPVVNFTSPMKATIPLIRHMPSHFMLIAASMCGLLLYFATGVCPVLLFTIDLGSSVWLIKRCRRHIRENILYFVCPPEQ